MTNILVSAAPDYLDAALAGLGAHAPGWESDRAGADCAIFEAEDVLLARLAALCREEPLPFVRHLSEVRAIASDAALDETFAAVMAAEPELERALADRTPIGLQVWSAEGVSGPAPGETARRLRTILENTGHRVVAKGFDFALHVCFAKQGAIVGAALVADALSDWPGGRVRLKSSDDAVSRAERKLDEAILVFGIALPAGGVAIDLGASPGGWTRLLARRGLTVHAVDPASLDPGVATLKGVVQHRMTAQEFLMRSDLRADLLVNDMRMDPLESAGIMLSLAERVKGAAVMTLKLPERGGAARVAPALDLLRTRFRVTAARQLYHNRSEVTVVLAPA
jgi:23S rRNA (cytidine2498-2'-O)-methyltransferase